MNSDPKQTNLDGGVLSRGTRNHTESPEGSVPDQGAVLCELELILASPFFHASKRSQQFLNYVVRYRLDGNEAHLKERTIGSFLYNRPADYATGDDSVVRVQAGEVRKRLEQYYKTAPPASLVHIELPLGSYVPEFRWRAPLPPPADVPAPLIAELPEAPVSPVNTRPAAGFIRKTRFWAIGLIGMLVLAAAALAGYTVYRQRMQSALNQFWSPVFATPAPALICLPKPIFYRPSTSLFKKNEKFAGEFDNEVNRENGRPNLQPDDQIRWGDMVEWDDFGVSKGDVKAAFRLSNLLIKLGKSTELKIGNDYGWDDLRNSPAVIIGAFSNQSTIKITSGLHFAFAEGKGKPSRIQEQGGAGRAWFDEVDPHTSQVATDYGLVTRLVDSSTGQFVVSVAGITAPGSEAAGEVAGSSEDLERALRSAPRDWKRRNVQIVVETTVTDGVAGPPQIVAVYVW
jgi:hypothetical protein